MTTEAEAALIKKEVLHAGKTYVPLRDGCKVHFHFQARRADNDNSLVDDSKTIGNKEPMVLVLGKKFKLECWEVMVNKMAVGEVAKFTVDKSLVIQYPFVSKTLRDINKKDKRTHFCGVTLQNEGIGYKDLNELIAHPQDLIFIFELLKVDYPEDYEKDSWQLSDEERLNNIPVLKGKGNELFKQKLYKEASDVYHEAISYCENLMVKEKPHDEEWKKLDSLKIPLLLNYSQCKLMEGDYYAVIEHCTSVLKSDPDNVKALYRRAKAEMAAWSPSAAIADFNRVKKLDPSLTASINKDLQTIEETRKQRDAEDKEKLKNLFT